MEIVNCNLQPLQLFTTFPAQYNFKSIAVSSQLLKHFIKSIH